MTKNRASKATGLSVYWYLTFRCNLECQHCWVESSPQAGSDELSGPDLTRTIDSIMSIKPCSISISGGEPFIHRDWGAIIEGLSNYGVAVSIETNGTLLTNERLQHLSVAVDNGMPVALGVSVDGGTAQDHDFLRGKGSFQRTVEGIMRAREYPVSVSIQCVVNSRNHNTLGTMFALAQRLGIEQLVFAFLHPVGRAAKSGLELSYDQTATSFEQIMTCSEQTGTSAIVKLPPAAIRPDMFASFDQLQQKSLVTLSTSCAFPMLSVLPDGRVSVCALTRDTDCMPESNAIRDNLVDIWNEHKLEEMKDSYHSADWLEGICRECVFKKGCKGSCRALPFEQTGKFSGPHPTCQRLADEGVFPQVYRR